MRKSLGTRNLRMARGTVRGLAALAVLLAPSAARAGELRVLVEADGSVREDGNYQQRAQPETPEGEPEGEPVEVDREGDQTVARSGLRLDLSYALPRSTFALAYNPSYERSLDNSDLSGFTHALRAGFSGELSRRSRLRLSDRLVASESFESTAIALTPANGTAEPIAVTRRGDQLANSFNATVDLDMTRRTGLVLGGTHHLRTFEETDLFDSSGVGVSAGYRFNPTAGRTWGLNAGADRYEFETDREAETYHASVSYGTGVARDGHLFVDLGGYRVQSRDAPRDPVERHSGLRGSLGMSWQRELWSWGLGYHHGVAPGIGLGRAVLADSAYAGISTSGRPVTLALSGNASRTRELDEEKDGEGSVDTATGTLRVSWNFTQWGRLTAGYSRIWQEAGIEPFENLSYSRYFLGIGLRIYESGERPIDPTEVGETEDDEPDPR